MKRNLLLIVMALSHISLFPYPIDGYELTHIKRLLYLQMVQKGEIKGTLPKEGALLSVNDIKLNLLDARGDSLEIWPASQ